MKYVEFVKTVTILQYCLLVNRCRHGRSIGIDIMFLFVIVVTVVVSVRFKKFHINFFYFLFQFYLCNCRPSSIEVHLKPLVCSFFFVFFFGTPAILDNDINIVYSTQLTVTTFIIIQFKIITGY